ncbi:hypothetical protein TSUD_252050 [Trifolium subterraneum]|uniref:Uncharacterized protein n=1 Tax=Trifolium subterraneum TaxID=3900 RepID=A0A2Z6MZA9_TRISU|nr:hypothetical protein TSUD_252050 [Trifolium subterraneum]
MVDFLLPPPHLISCWRTLSSFEFPFSLDSSGFIELAFNCTITILWKGTGASWRKVHELYPRRWTSGCSNHSNVVVRFATILAPRDSPNTDGIDPGDVGDHADDKYDHNALPIVKGITIVNVWGVKVLQAGLIKGIKNSPFSDICLSDINLHGVNGTRSRTPSWMCSDVVGVAHEVSPWPCSELITQQLGSCANY